MSLTTCIPDLIANGSIPANRSDDIRARYDQLLDDYLSEGMDRAVAETKATNQAIKLLERDHLRKKVNMLKQVQAQDRWQKEMEMRSPDDGPIDIRRAEDIYQRLDKKIDVVRGRFFETLDEFLTKHRRNLLGEVRNKDDLALVGRELFGESTGDLNAKEMADAIARVFEIARQRFNAAGGDIGKIDGGYIPQRHDSKALRQAGFEAWREHPSVDAIRVRDLDTGEWARGVKRETLLRQVFETISTEGANKANPGAMFAGAMANRRGDPRILHFDNFDDWIAYQRDFGGGEDVFDVVSSHISMMARDIAMMEEMGPNPAATLRYQQDALAKSIGIKGSEKDRGNVVGRQKVLQKSYDELTGANRIPSNEKLALGFSAYRSVQVASSLGSAVLSAVPDFATMMWTAGFNRTPVGGMLSRYAKLWASGEERQLAVRLGLVTSDWINLSSATARYTGEELTGEISRRLAEFTIRAQGLARHTRNGQWAFGMEFLNHLSMMRERSFANLDPGLQRSMQRYGIGEGEWDQYRATPTRTERGTEWIFPTDNDAVGERFLQMVLTETDYAIIMPDLRTRRFVNGSFEAGTWLGEVAKSGFLFKSFPLAVLNLHGRRMMMQEGLTGKLGYTVPLLLMMTAGGAVAAQLKMLANGKDPQPMEDRLFWGKAIAQGGGLGLLADLLFNSENSYGGGLFNSIIGPIGQDVSDFGDALVANPLKGMGAMDAPEDFDAVSETVKDTTIAIERNMPLRNLWYSRKAYEMVVADSIRRLVDPDADAYFERREKRAEKEGTAYFAPPGEGPDAMRAPDLGNALGD